MTPLRVIIAGGGVAALEATFALHALAREQVDITLIAAGRSFEHRPVDVRDPLAVDGRIRVPLASLAAAAGAELRHDRIVGVDVAARCVHTAGAHELPYDALVVAERAVPQPVPAGAQPLDDDHVSECRRVINDVRSGRAASLAFIEPAAPTDPFDLYDLAIEVASGLHGQGGVLTLVTAGAGPLAILGSRGAAMVHETLCAHGVHVVTPAYVRSVGGGGLDVVPNAQHVAGERIIAAPRVSGPRIQGLPSDLDGFLATDPHAAVPNADGIFAAGDCAAFPIKHPSIAAQQADAAAMSVAALAGADIDPEPFSPVLRCILPARLRWYVEAPLVGGLGEATSISAFPLWSRHLRFDAPYLAPHIDPSVGVLAS
jgi:sulfide:quinone oxidoreductase